MDDLSQENGGKTKNLLSAVLLQSIKDLRDTKENTDDIIADAIRFLEDKYNSKWGFSASQIAEYVGCGGAVWRKEIDKKVKAAREILKARKEKKD